MDIDKLITEARKNGNTTELEICQLIKAAFIENKHAKNLFLRQMYLERWLKSVRRLSKCTKKQEEMI